MTRPLFRLTQIIPVLIVIAMGVLPLYGQADSQADTFKAAAQSNQDGPCFGTPEDESVSRRGYAIRTVNPAATPLSGVRMDLSKAARLEFTTSASETSVDVSSVKVDTAEADTQTNSLRYVVPRDAAESSALLPQSTTDPFVFPTRKERFNRYLKSMFGPSALLRSAVNAGINQWKDSPEEWEQGMSGYGKRYASSFGKNVVNHTVIYGLDSALGWDTGFRKSPSKEFGERLKHALLENITSRTKTGKRVVSVPRIAGAYTSGVVSREAWYPERYDWKDGLRSGTSSLLLGFAYNLVREFVVSF